MRRLALISLLGLAVGGCGWVNDYLAGSDNSLPPADLQPIDQPLSVQSRWQVSVGSGAENAFVKLQPAVGDGRIYAASRDGVVLAVAADTGRVIWQVDAGFTVSGGVGRGDGVVLVASDQGRVLALREDTGEEAWRAQVSSEVLAPPRVTPGIVIVRTVDGKFHGLDSRTGTPRWPPYSVSVPALTLRGTAPPLLLQDVAIAGLDSGKLLVLSLARGAPVSEMPIALPQGRTELERLVDVDAEPRFADGMLYVAAYQGNVTAIDLRSGGVAWTRTFSNHSGLDLDGRTVYIADENDTVWALDRMTGAVRWQQDQLRGRRLSTPVVSGEYVVVGDLEGYVHWLNTRTGKVEGRQRVDSERIVVAPVADGGTLYVLSQGGKLNALQIGG